MDNNRDEHNRGGMIALIGSVVFCILFFIYISFIHPGIDLKEVPEAPVAGQTLAGGDAAPVFDIASIAKPWLESADVATYGQKVFKNNCAVCHGDTGAGDGAAGAALVPPPRNLIEGKWKRGGTSIALYETLQKGLEGSSMAAFKHLPKADRWALVQYMRSITKNKEADDEAKLEAFAATAD